MESYYITFGQQSVFRDYYLLILATSDKEALRVAQEQFKHISMVYTEKEFIENNVVDSFPNGLLFFFNTKKNTIWRPAEY
jgi:hypothetical protein